MPWARSHSTRSPWCRRTVTLIAQEAIRGAPNRLDGCGDDPAHHHPTGAERPRQGTVFFGLDGDTAKDLAEGPIESGPRQTGLFAKPNQLVHARVSSPARSRVAGDWVSISAARRRTESTSLRGPVRRHDSLSIRALRQRPLRSSGAPFPRGGGRLRLGLGAGGGSSAAGAKRRIGNATRITHSYKRSGTDARSRPAENDVGPTGQRNGGFRAVAARSMASTTRSRSRARRRRADWRW